MTCELLEDARQRIESAMVNHVRFVHSSREFLHDYVKGMLKGFDENGAFCVQLRKPADGRITGRPRVLAAEIVEGVRSALDYTVFALSARNNPDMNPKHPKFVIADDKAGFDAQATALKHLTDAERSFVEALQPYATNSDMLALVRNAANRVKHRNLLTIDDNSPLEVVFAEMAKKDEYKGWWCYPQDKGNAVFARGELRVFMLGQYDAIGLLGAMIESGAKIVGAFDRYLTTGQFPSVRPN